LLNKEFLISSTKGKKGRETVPFEFRELEIPGVMVVVPKASRDERGFFMETYKHSDFARAGIKEHFIQDNHSESSKHVLRGLHYQNSPNEQGKLVRCIRGKIFDVAVDIRRDSSTFGKWVGLELSEENNVMLYVPPPCAHGFVVLSDTAEVIYKCTKEYSPADERGIIWNDPDINISWPVREPVLSGRDAENPLLRNAELST
jgi:dTDP-4-dehydrorhamnose 3,5-epimerase